MSHILDYDETIPMPGLDRSWYQDVSVDHQRALMKYDEDSRMIFNQKTRKFVVVFRVGELAENYWMDFNGSKLCGWMIVKEVGHDPGSIDALLANLWAIDQKRKHGSGKKAAEADARAITEEHEKKQRASDAEWDILRDDFVKMGQKQAVRSIPGQTCAPLDLGRRSDAPTEKRIIIPGHPNWR